MSAGRSGQGTSRDPHPLHLFGGGLDLLERGRQTASFSAAVPTRLGRSPGSCSRSKR